MNKLTKTLLSGAALAALTAGSAMAAQHPAFHVTALYPGKAVNKTRIHVPPTQEVTYTFGVYSTQPASAPPGTHLPGTYYKWSSNNDICTAPWHKNKVPNNSIYAAIGAATELRTLGCTNDPIVFYGDTWSNQTGAAGDTDLFVSRLRGKFKNAGVKYKGTLILDVFVKII